MKGFFFAVVLKGKKIYNKEKKHPSDDATSVPSLVIKVPHALSDLLRDGRVRRGRIKSSKTRLAVRVGPVHENILSIKATSLPSVICNASASARVGLQILCTARAGVCACTHMRDGVFIFIHSSLATTVRLLSVRFWGASTDDDDEIISYNPLEFRGFYNRFLEGWGYSRVSF